MPPTPVSACSTPLLRTLRVYLAPHAQLRRMAFAWSATLIWIGVITMAVGVMYAMVQTDLKRMLAFSTVSQIGYMMMESASARRSPSPPACSTAQSRLLQRRPLPYCRLRPARRRNPRHESPRRLAQKMPHTTLSWLIGIAA